jgi:hypothetical protein
MNAKLSRNAKMACNLLVFNVLCVLVFSIILPFLLAWNLVYAVYKSIADLAVPLVEENKRIYRSYYPKTKPRSSNKPQPQHNSISLN